MFKGNAMNTSAKFQSILNGHDMAPVTLTANPANGNGKSVKALVTNDELFLLGKADGMAFLAELQGFDAKPVNLRHDLCILGNLEQHHWEILESCIEPGEYIDAPPIPVEA